MDQPGQRFEGLRRMDDDVLGQQITAADEGEAGSELLLLEAAGLAAEVAQGDAQQPGGQLDPLGVATDPEQLFCDPAWDFKGRRMPVFQRPRAFHLGLSGEICGRIRDPNVFGEACMSRPHLRCLAGFPDLRQTAGEDHWAAGGIQGERPPNNRPLADAARF